MEGGGLGPKVCARVCVLRYARGAGISGQGEPAKAGSSCSGGVHVPRTRLGVKAGRSRGVCTRNRLLPARACVQQRDHPRALFTPSLPRCRSSRAEPRATHKTIKPPPEPPSPGAVLTPVAVMRGIAHAETATITKTRKQAIWRRASRPGGHAQLRKSRRETRHLTANATRKRRPPPPRRAGSICRHYGMHAARYADKH